MIIVFAGGVMRTDEPEKLLDFVTDLAGENLLKVEQDLGAGYVRLNIGEAERRQARHDIRCVEDVVVEMVRNSRDAGAKVIFIAGSRDSSGIRRLAIIDDGEGVPESFHQRIFEPRVTSKVDNLIEDRLGVHGRGMALYSIKSNVDKIDLVNSEPGNGSAFYFEVAKERLSERKDQSTFPKLKISSANKVTIVSGPHNIWRQLAEITLETPKLDIFFGTAAEVLATLSARSRAETGGRYIWTDLMGTTDGESLRRFAAARLGLAVSERNCQRIIAGEIEPVHSIKCRLAKINGKRPVPKVSARSRAGKIAGPDLEEFAQGVAREFQGVGEKYFLKLAAKPKVTSVASRIRIELDLESEDGW